MDKLTANELRVLSEFFNMVAVGWFTGGVIAPFFAAISSFEKLLFFAAGAALSYISVNISLVFAREMKE